MGGFMKIGSFIISGLDNDIISPTLSSLRKHDKMFIVTNQSTTKAKEKLNGISSGCEPVNLIESDLYIEKSYSNFSWIDLKSNYFSLSDIYDVFTKFEYVHICHGRILFYENFTKEILEQLEKPNTGAVYSDYHIRKKDESKPQQYLQSIYPSLHIKQDIKSAVFNTTYLERTTITNEDLFLSLMNIYSKSIVRHIPRPLYLK